MGNKTKTYQIDDILKGYNDSDKLTNLYSDLRNDIILQEPIWKSDKDMVTIINSQRNSHYGWELYEVNNSLLMLEYFGRWQGYAHESRYAPSVKEASLHAIRLTINNSNAQLEEGIEKIISKYPNDS